MVTKTLGYGLMTGALFVATLLPAGADEARLAIAARECNRREARLLLQQKVDVNATLGDGTTALHWAAYNDDAELAALLLRAGANPKATTRVGAITPLSLAAASGDPALVATLLRAGADPNVATETGETPLMTAAASGSVAVVNVLLDRGAQVNARESVHGQTPLMFAAVKNRAEVIRTLIRRGADPKLTSKVTTLERPRFDDDGNPIAERPAGANANGGRRARGGEGENGSAGNGDSGGRPARSVAPDDSGAAIPDGTALAGRSFAAENEGTGAEARKRPAASGAAGTVSAAAAAAPRRAAAKILGGNTALTLAARDGRLSAVRALADAGADINQPTAGDRTTPLVIAICNGHYTVAKYLLDRGADPNLASVDGLAALYAVIDTQWAPVGWAPNPITGDEHVTYLDLMQALLERGAQANTRLTRKLWFRPTHHDETWIGTVGATPFWRAAQATDLAAMRLLIAHGADPKIPTIDGDNALMVAAGLGWNGNFSTQGPDSALDTVRYCLELGLDPTPQDLQGYTALAGAAYRGDNELVQLLAEHGAKLDVRTSRGWTLTDMANGPSLRSSVPVAHPYTVALLLKLGAPALTPVEGEEILGIIRRRPTTPSATEPAAQPTTDIKKP